jgi:hypothetical protein
LNRSVAQLVFAQAILMSVNTLMVPSAAIIGGPNLANLSREVFTVTYLGTLLSVVVVYGLNSINFLFMKLPKPVVQAIIIVA